MAKKDWKPAKRISTAWYDFSLPISAQSGTIDGMTILAGSNSLAPQPSTGLDWGRKEWLTLVRVIAKILLVLTSTGAEQYVKFLWGLRITELDMDGSLRTSADNPNLQNTDDDSRRVDWIWRDSTSLVVPSTSGAEVVSVLRELSMDFKPNRRFPPNCAVVLHVHQLLLGTSTNGDAVMTADIDGRLLLGRKG